LSGGWRCRNEINSTFGHDRSQIYRRKGEFQPGFDGPASASARPADPARRVMIGERCLLAGSLPATVTRLAADARDCRSIAIE
jgi:hypothetical protein